MTLEETSKRRSRVHLIYVVEDTEAERKMLQYQLRRIVDATVQSFSSVAECIAAIQKFPPQVVVTGYTLKDSTGEAISEYCESKMLGTPVVIVSSDGAQVDRLLENGFIAARKPYGDAENARVDWTLFIHHITRIVDQADRRQFEDQVFQFMDRMEALIDKTVGMAPIIQVFEFISQAWANETVCKIAVLIFNLVKWFGRFVGLIFVGLAMVYGIVFWKGK